MRLTNNDRSSLNVWALMLLLPIAACSGGPDHAAVAQQSKPVPAEHSKGEPTQDAKGGQPTRSARKDIPSRASEKARDPYSKPDEVYAFSGIGQGSVVADFGAGGGYNTYLLAKRVGDAGKVYAVGGNAALAQRLDHGDMARMHNVVIPENAMAVPDGVVDVALLVREFHLAPDHAGYLANLHRILKPGGKVTVVEVRTGKPEGYDHKTHRSGEQTIIKEFVAGGFALDGQSDILRRDDDDYTKYGGSKGKRYMTDRMLLRFRRVP